MRLIPPDPYLQTTCPVSVKAKITELEIAVLRYTTRPGEANKQTAQTARYNLEQTVLSCISAAVKEAKKP